MSKDELDAVIKEFGGVYQLAAALTVAGWPVTHPTIYRWRASKRGVPAVHAPHIRRVATRWRRVFDDVEELL